MQKINRDVESTLYIGMIIPRDSVIPLSCYTFYYLKFKTFIFFSYVCVPDSYKKILQNLISMTSEL